MAFGFPYAAHTALIDLDADRQSIREAVPQALRSIGWEFENPHPDKFVAKIPLSASSWGEKLTVRLTEEGHIEVESRCGPFPQLFDWGKNQKNVEQFLEVITATAETIAKTHSLDRSQFDADASTPLERVLSGDESTT